MRILYALLFTLSSITVFAQKENCNCCTENHKAFDFWIGEWDVTKPDGTKAGTNVLRKIEDGCVLVENWTGANANYTGTSYNFYNKQTGMWEQLWIDNQGQHLYLTGKPEANTMVLWSDEIEDAQGNIYVNRVTWTHNADGTVRQHWETSTDKKDWKTVFDGLYTRKK